MDMMSILGLIVAFGSILGGNVLEGGHIGALINGPATLIVIGGSFGATMLQAPMSVFMRSIKILSWLFITPPKVSLAAIEQIISWSNIARKEGLLGLETVVESETNTFAQKGLQLLVDGSEPDIIRNILEVDMGTKEKLDLAAAKLYETMGGYTPTVGIIGAVLGLIHVMANLADPSALGSGIATAFIATIYGVGAANLVLLPAAGKLKSIIQDNSQKQEMMIEGIISIAEGENPRNIETKLQGYIL